MMTMLKSVLTRAAMCLGVPEKSARFESTAVALRGGEIDRRDAMALASLRQYGFGWPRTSSPSVAAWNDCCEGEPIGRAGARTHLRAPGCATPRCSAAEAAFQVDQNVKCLANPSKWVGGSSSDP